MVALAGNVVRPCAVLVGTWDVREVAAVRAIFATVVVAKILQPKEVGLHPDEIDVVILDELDRAGDVGRYTARAHVICFAATGRLRNGDGTFVGTSKGQSASFELTDVDPLLVSLRDDYAERLATAMGATVLVDEEPDHDGISALRGERPPHTNTVDGALLLCRAPRTALAIVRTRRSTTSHGRPLGLAWIPRPRDRLAWVRAVTTLWAPHIPGIPTWEQAKDWLTPAELEIEIELENLQARRKSLLSALQAEEKDLRDRLLVQKAVADNGVRRLLTANGDALVQAVAKALETIGFDVESRDEQLEPGQAKREDLVLRDATTGWIALVEVRGYARGSAKGEDLRRLERFRRNFENETSLRVTKLIYIVNAQTDTPPNLRHRPFESTPEVDAGLREDNVLVVDSRDLFWISTALPGERVRAHSAILEEAGVLDWRMLCAGQLPKPA